jgi:hypothetical protein
MGKSQLSDYFHLKNNLFKSLRNVKYMLICFKSPSEASDGNIYSVDLKCPNCRGKYKVNLSDVLLLREFESQLYLQNINDSELNAADLRKKHQWNDGKLILINDAQKRYQAHTDDIEDSTRIKSDTDDINLSDKDTAFLAEKIMYVDNMVFQGLEYGLTDDEKGYLINLMTSGSVNKLVRGIEALHGIIEMNAQTNLLRKQNPKTESNPSNAGGSSRNITMKSRPKASQTAPIGRAVAKNTSKLEYERATHNRWSSLYPLPYRMPRVVNIKLDFDPYMKKSPLRVIDDEDTFAFLEYDQPYNQVSYENRLKIVKDAYTMLSVSSGKLKRREASQSMGVDNVMSGIEMDLKDHTFEDGIPTLDWRRIIISHADFRLGLRNGDVITHVDGDRFRGNAEKLRWLIASRRTEQSMEEIPSIQLIVNAEIGVAEVLRLRSFMARVQSDI